MYLVVKNKLIKYKFDIEPIFKRGRLVYPVNALDIKEDEVQVIETSKTLDYEFVDGAIGWDPVTHNGFYLHSPEVYDDYLEAKRKASIPQTITPRQARLILLQYNLLDDIELLIKDNRAIQIWWEYSTDIQRNNEQLLEFATIAGLSDEQLDTMFIEASKL